MEKGQIQISAGGTQHSRYEGYMKLLPFATDSLCFNTWVVTCCEQVRGSELQVGTTYCLDLWIISILGTALLRITAPVQDQENV